MKITKKTGEKKPLSSALLQVELLRFLLANHKKSYTPGQLRALLEVSNSKHSVRYALEQLAIAGSATALENASKYAVNLKRLTTDAAAPLEEETNDPDALPLDLSDEPRPKKVKRVKEAPKNEGKTTISPKFLADQAAIFPKETPVAPRANAKVARKTYAGVVDMTRTGSAFIVCDTLDKDVFVGPRNLNGAMNGDKVEITLYENTSRGRKITPADADKRREGAVVRILQRSTDYLMGTIRITRKYALLLPSHATFTTEVYIPHEHTNGAKDGDIVIIRLYDEQSGPNHVLRGKVTTVLGKVGNNDFEMNKILINQGFNLTFPEEVIAESESLPTQLSPQEIARRRDFRDILTFTIDPEDAKDFDDAISYRLLEDGQHEVGIHIADVTHYVRPGSSLDIEALKRSTSVYLVDRVCPMLPERLSNGLCSLVPNEDRPVFSAVFVFNEKNQITSRWFGKSVIHSAKRFSYEEAQTIIEKKPSAELKKHPLFPQLKDALGYLLKLSLKMRAEREKNGAINFESDEIRFRLEPDGTPIEAYVKERKEAHKLVEDYMLLANREVATYIHDLGKDKQSIPFVYRVHDMPDMEKVAELARFALEMGVKMQVDTPQQIAKSYNRLMEEAQKDPRLKLLSPLAIRTMAKAIYTTENIGHYGLGFQFYTHFTSPIRRYADVWVHRILDRNLDGATYRVDKAKLEEQCKHISAQEKKAADAERESIKLKQVEMISKHIGKEFDGVVSGIIDRGLFVELEGSKAEGMLPFSVMDDLYIMDGNGLHARGRRNGKVYSMGDRIRVRVMDADAEKRRIEFGMATDL